MGKEDPFPCNIIAFTLVAIILSYLIHETMAIDRRRGEIAKGL